MNRNLVDLSEKIDPLSRDLYEVLDRVATSKGIRFFIVGASARDMLLEHAHGISSPRATADVDTGIRVSCWEEFEEFKGDLLQTGEFERTQRPHRFLFRSRLPLDIIPFGELDEPNDEITWPSDRHIVMSVVGFEEAYNAAQPVRLRKEPPLDIMCATPAGLAMLKIVAWAERPADLRRKDASDLNFIMRNYLDAGNLERLVNDHVDLFAQESSDYERAGARLLGRDIRKIAALSTRSRLLSILQQQTGEQERYPLVREMVQQGAIGNRGYDESFEEHLALLTDLRKGVQGE